jgi:hypothetical protein
VLLLVLVVTLLELVAELLVAAAVLVLTAWAACEPALVLTTAVSPQAARLRASATNTIPSLIGRFFLEFEFNIIRFSLITPSFSFC